MDYSKKGRDQMQVLNYCAKLSHISKPRLDKIIEAVNDPESSEMLEHAKSLAEAKEVFDKKYLGLLDSNVRLSCHNKFCIVQLSYHIL